MKTKILAILLTLVMSTSFTVWAANDNPDENPGDIVTNPWGDLFTETNTTAGDLPLDTTTAPAESTTNGAENLNINIAAQGEHDPTQKVGSYDIYAGSWNDSTAKAGVDGNDADHIKVAALSSKWYEPWGLQIQKNIDGLTASTAYTFEFNIKSDNDDGKVKITGSDAEIPLTGEAQKLEGTVTTDANGHAMIAIGMGWVGLNNGVEVFDLTVKDAQGNVVYPKAGGDTTTAAVTTTAQQTTKAETTTQQQTTTASGTETTPQGVETTAQGAVTTAQGGSDIDPSLAKVKIKKVFKKKKSAKKVKIKVKKVAGAKGYLVAIYKTKKNAKKNKKALVKKYVKKNKATFVIKSAKLKNKKKLFVKVRAYKKVDGVVKFGAWSAMKKIK